MVFKKFRLKILVRVLLLAATIFLFFFLLDLGKHFITPVLVGAVAVYQIFSLIYFIEKTNRDLTSFLESIRFADFSRSFQIEGLGSSFDDLKRAFNAVIADFQKIRSEKEEHYFYLQNIIQHIAISIIAYLKDGNVEMINNTAKKLFQIHSIKNINSLRSWSEELVDVLMNISPGENALVKVQDFDDLLQLSIYATEFKIDERTIIIVSIKDIQAELEEQEMEAWQKLIRVLTHEIMNSIAPIASLSSTTNLMVKDIYESFENVFPENLDKETLEDIQSALDTIHKRSTGLIHFVETYRNLTRIPKPNFAIFKVKILFEYIHKLLEKDFNERSVALQTNIEPEELELLADEQLIEQVIINLVKNSLHALDNTPKPVIQLRAFLNKRNRPTIQVTDNGVGIIKEVRDKIFIPFFTTKPSGSGIGLSLSKQIMRLHNGTISVQSEPEVETTFTLTFQ